MAIPFSPETAIHEQHSRLRGARIVVVSLALCCLPQPAAVAGEAVDGRQLFDEACAACHGPDGQETVRGRARRLDSLSADAVRDYLMAARTIDTPTRPYQRLKKGLSDAEVEALASYVGQFLTH